MYLCKKNKFFHKSTEINLTAAELKLTGKSVPNVSGVNTSVNGTCQCRVSPWQLRVCRAQWTFTNHLRVHARAVESPIHTPELAEPHTLRLGQSLPSIKAKRERTTCAHGWQKNKKRSGQLKARVSLCVSQKPAWAPRDLRWSQRKVMASCGSWKLCEMLKPQLPFS